MQNCFLTEKWVHSICLNIQILIQQSSHSQSFLFLTPNRWCPWQSVEQNILKSIYKSILLIY